MMWQIALIVVVALAAAAVAAPLFRRREPWDQSRPTELDALFEAKARELRALKDLDHDPALHRHQRSARNLRARRSTAWRLDRGRGGHRSQPTKPRCT